ncbi:MAG: DUF1631 family protein [Luminiphilus sp.]|nr:DUF1631 family protein [Luminiphilus sp.]
MNESTDRDEIIASLEALAVERLTPCLSLILEETADYLFTLSTSSRLDQKNQDQCYSAFVTLQGSIKSVVHQITRSVSDAFGRCGASQNSAVTTVESDEPIRLALVPLEEFEDTLAIEKIVRAGTERYWLELESMIFRLAARLERDPKRLELPVSPRTLCSAYRQSLKDIDFPRTFLVDADSAFVRKLLPELARIYLDLNAHLASHELLPDIEGELKKTGSQILVQLHSKSEAESADGEQAASPQMSGSTALPQSLSVPQHDIKDLIHSGAWINAHALDALSGRIPASAFNRTSVSLQTATEAQLTAAGGRARFVPARLAAPLRDEAARNRLLSTSQEMLNPSRVNSLELASESLRISQALAKVRRENTGKRHSVTSIIEAVGFIPKAAIYDRLVEAHKISSALFDYVLERVMPPEQMLPPLVRLELCFLELALSDEDFLIQGDHPGRLLVDRIADLVTLLPRGKARHLEGFITAVDAVNARFDGSPMALSTAANTLGDLSTLLISQQRQNRDRLIARENAKDRIDSARVSVVTALNDVVGDTDQSEHLIAMITNGLIDHWVVQLLKGQSLDKMKTDLETLIAFAGNEENPPATTVSSDDIFNIIGDKPKQRPAVTAAYEALLIDREKGSVSVASAPTQWRVEVDLTPLELDAILSSRPRLARAARAVQQLAVDTWFLQKGGHGHVYLQVVWVNRHATRFVLSDERGVKQRDMSLIELARKLGRSLKTLSTIEQLSLVEQTLFSKLSDAKDDISQQFQARESDALAALTHETERALRRARRTGTKDSLIAFEVSGDWTDDALTDALNAQNLSIGIVKKLRTHIACALVRDAMPKTITHAVLKAFSEETAANLSIALVDHQTHSDARALINGVLDNTSSESVGTTPATDAAVPTPKTLDDAVAEAFARLEPTAHAIRLSPVIRVSVRHERLLESAYVIRRYDDNQKDLGGSSQFRHRDLEIAINYFELREACRLLQALEALGETTRHVLLRLSAETCLHASALDRILTQISEHTVGTSQLSFLIPDSIQVRESVICHRLTRALRSIGCHIVIENYNPARGSSESIQRLNPSDVTLETSFWELAAQNEPWATVLPQIIADVHHILGHTVTVRDPDTTAQIEATGIDFIERESDVSLSISEFLASIDQ